MNISRDNHMFSIEEDSKELLKIQFDDGKRAVITRETLENHMVLYSKLTGKGYMNNINRIVTDKHGNHGKIIGMDNSLKCRTKYIVLFEDNTIGCYSITDLNSGIFSKKNNNKLKYIDRIVVDRKGNKGKIVKYALENKYVVRFEDGVEAKYNITYLKAGTFLHPKEKKESIREKMLNSVLNTIDGHKYTVLGINSNMVKVQFDTGEKASICRTTVLYGEVSYERVMKRIKSKN